MEKKRIMKRQKKYTLKNALEKLNIGAGFSKHEFIISMWNDVNHKLERKSYKYLLDSFPAICILNICSIDNSIE